MNLHLQIDETSTHQNSGNTYITYSCTVTIFSIIFMLNITQYNFLVLLRSVYFLTIIN
jgi:hypothetical protein